MHLTRTWHFAENNRGKSVVVRFRGASGRRSLVRKVPTLVRGFSSTGWASCWQPCRAGRHAVIITHMHLITAAGWLQMDGA